MRFMARTLLLACVLLPACPASAQIPLPRLPTADLPVTVPVQVLRDVDEAAVRPAISSVRTRTRDLLRRYPGQVERDPRGSPIVRAVILALSPSEAALQQALSQGYQILGDQTLQPLGDRIVTLLVPVRLSTDRALRQLRAADPGASYDFDHLFVESAAAAADARMPPAAAAAVPPAVDVLVGLIDGGVDVEHPVFASNKPRLSGCGTGAVPSAHGTAVASLFVGRSAQFHGAAPGASLLAVDVYCEGGAPGGRVRDIVLGLSQLLAAGVRVVNISVVGPDNAVLAAVIRRLVEKSVIVVAATGNDGPNAAPLFPAAYPGVVAVTAVDSHEKVLMEASGGDHVRFAAPGADMLAAAPGGQFASVRGTSYASPLVAGILAGLLAREGDGAAARVVQQLAQTARDRGRAGRDRRYGYGLVGMELRTDPRRFDARIPAH